MTNNLWLMKLWPALNHFQSRCVRERQKVLVTSFGSLGPFWPFSHQYPMFNKIEFLRWKMSPTKNNTFLIPPSITLAFWELTKVVVIVSQPPKLLMTKLCWWFFDYERYGWQNHHVDDFLEYWFMAVTLKTG